MKEIDHFGLIKNGIIEKRLKYTTLNEKGFESKYYISNDGDLETFYRHIDILVDAIVGNNIRKERKFMEYLDVYDKDKKLVGKTIERYQSREDLKDGEFFLFEQAWIINLNKEILLTKRAPNKKYGGIWEPTSGHVKSGESSLEGIKRELNEELGIEVNDNEINLVKSYIDKKSIREIWIVEKDVKIEDLKYIDREVSDAKFVNIQEFEQMINQNETFNNLQYFIELYNDIIK